MYGPAFPIYLRRSWHWHCIGEKKVTKDVYTRLVLLALLWGFYPRFMSFTQQYDD